MTALLIIAQIAIVVALLAAAVLAGNPLVEAVFRLADKGGHSRRSRDAQDPVARLSAKGQLRGGLWIGYLERVAVFGALFAGYPEGVALPLAIKGLARYPELKHTEGEGTAERFIIGTFTSVIFGCGCAALARWLIGLF